MEQDKLQKFAYWNDLVECDTTIDESGKRIDVKRGAVFFDDNLSFEEVKQMAEQNHFKLCLLAKRNGNDYWVRKGEPVRKLDINDYLPIDEVVFDKSTAIENMKEMISETNDLEITTKIVKHTNDLLEFEENAEENNVVIDFGYDSDPEYKSASAFTYEYDVWTYAIGIIEADED